MLDLSDATFLAMTSVGIRELKNRLSAYLRMVRRGEEILVTDLQVLSLDERIRVNAVELGFDVVPAD